MDNLAHIIDKKMYYYRGHDGERHLMKYSPGGHREHFRLNISFGMYLVTQKKELKKLKEETK